MHVLGPRCFEGGKGTSRRLVVGTEGEFYYSRAEKPSGRAGRGGPGGRIHVALYYLGRFWRRENNTGKLWLPFTVVVEWWSCSKATTQQAFRKGQGRFPLWGPWWRSSMGRVHTIAPLPPPFHVLGLIGRQVLTPVSDP